MNVGIRIVQDADGEDCIFRHQDIDKLLAEEGDKEAAKRVLYERRLEEWTKNAEKVLSSDPNLMILFQQGAILEIYDDDPECRHYIGMQIAGIAGNKRKKDKRRSWGFISATKTSEKERVSMSFDVRLKRTGVPG